MAAINMAIVAIEMLNAPYKEGKTPTQETTRLYLCPSIILYLDYLEKATIFVA